MKKLLVIAMIAILGQSAVMAQKAKTVKEQDVPSTYVRDFQKTAPNAKDVNWTMLDSVSYEVFFLSENNNKESILFTKKSTETRYYIEDKWYPQAIKDTVSNMYPKHKISSLYVRNVKNNATYQARVARMKGWFKKKESDVHFVNFGTDCKFISAE